MEKDKTVWKDYQEYTHEDLEVIAEYIREQQEAKMKLLKVVTYVATMPNKTSSVPFSALQDKCRDIMEYIQFVM
jgi:hypothetical protein